MKKQQGKLSFLWACLIGLIFLFGGCSGTAIGQNSSEKSPISDSTYSFSMEDVPEYSGAPYVSLNDNIPTFSAEEITEESFESYSEYDTLGRCQVAEACVGQDIMPTEERGAIGSVKPSGWHTVKYDGIDGKYLYNRCHLLSYQLTGENANEKNLITGTRYLNIEGMLPFENQVANYVKDTGNHVMYRVTPVFEENNLIATGVVMEGYSVEDQGEEICFHIFAYNVQPGIRIDYATGDSSLASQADSEIMDDAGSENEDEESFVWISSKGGKKYHSDPSCSGMKDAVQKSLEEAVTEGYEPCKKCYH